MRVVMVVVGETTTFPETLDIATKTTTTNGENSPCQVSHTADYAADSANSADADAEKSELWRTMVLLLP
ncbi:MAG: hypothetical protein ABI690_31445 [Chloroflexota bacterium]